jgi:type IV secretion system protein VirB9
MKRPRVLGLLAILGYASSCPAAQAVDSRLRSLTYSADAVYSLRGYVGYQIDLEFESGELFVGMGAGDIDGVSFLAQGNHLFIKPKASNVHTNLTVLTSRRTYHFDYHASSSHPESQAGDVIYALRFLYPAPAARPAEPAADLMLAQAQAARLHNTDYWYCGADSLRPVAAWDDGVHTHLVFDAKAELPALFVRNADGTESLLNFSIEQGEIVIHRVAAQFVLRRGQLRGCVLNRGYGGSSESLKSGTLAPELQRSLRVHDDAPSQQH